MGQAHAVIEPGKSIPIWKFHQMTGHTGENLLKNTAENMGIKLTGKLEPCEVCTQAKIGKANMTEFRQTLQVQSHLEMPGILVQLGHIQRT